MSYSASPVSSLSQSAVLGYVSTLVLAVTVGLLAALIALPPATAPALVPGGANVTVNCVGGAGFVENASVCPAPTTCVKGLLAEAATDCTYLPVPATVENCTSACYPTGATACDGAGHCVGADSAGCVGTCATNQACTGFLGDAFRSPLPGSFDPQSGWSFAGWYEPYGCWFGACVGGVMDIYVGSSTNPIYVSPSNLTYNFTVLAAQNQCEDYFLPDFLAAYRDCFTTERYLLAAAMVPNYNMFGSGTYGNATFPFQLSFCQVSFRCAVPFRATGASAGPVPVADNNATAVPYRTREQWGFMAGSAATAADDAPLGIRDPALRNAYWAGMNERVRAALPRFADALQSRLAELRVL